MSLYSLSLSSPEFTSPVKIASGSRRELRHRFIVGIARRWIAYGRRAAQFHVGCDRVVVCESHMWGAVATLSMIQCGKRVETTYQRIAKLSSRSADYYWEGIHTCRDFYAREKERRRKKKVQSVWKMTREIGMEIISAREEIATYNGSD